MINWTSTLEEMLFGGGRRAPVVSGGTGDWSNQQSDQSRSYAGHQFGMTMKPVGEFTQFAGYGDGRGGSGPEAPVPYNAYVRQALLGQQADQLAAQEAAQQRQLRQQAASAGLGGSLGFGQMSAELAGQRGLGLNEAARQIGSQAELANYEAARQETVRRSEWEQQKWQRMMEQVEKELMKQEVLNALRGQDVDRANAITQAEASRYGDYMRYLAAMSR